MKKDNTDAILYIDLTATPLLACLRVLASSSLALLLSSLDAVASLDRTFFDRSRTRKEVRKVEKGFVFNSSSDSTLGFLLFNKFFQNLLI